MTTAGFDIGNSRSKYAIPDPMGNPLLITNKYGEICTPSVVYFNPDKTISVGKEAWNAGFLDPSRLVIDWKRSMGTDEVLYQSDDGTSYTAKDILAILIKEGKESVEAKTGKVVNEAVFAVPANYDENQKRQTIEAAAQAGVEAILLLHEPTAAAIGNEIHRKKNCVALVYDLGGGTFDVSIIRAKGNVCDILATGGEPHIGGRDFNERICEKIGDVFEAEHSFRPNKDKHPEAFLDMMTRIEELKKSLSIQMQVPFVLFCEGKQIHMTVTREMFNEWIKDIAEKTMERTQKTVEEANLTIADIDEVYAVGGGSMMPIIPEMLESLTGKKVSKRCEPHYAAALGAVLAGRLEYQRQGKDYVPGDVVLPAPDWLLHEIVSHSVGVMVLDDKNKEICSEILAKDTPIPSTQTKLFKLCEPDQTAVTIRILQGQDGQNANECLQLGHFDLEDLPSRPDMIGRIEITFALDSNGLLTAKARDTASGKTGEMKIDYEASSSNNEVKGNAA